VGIPEAHELNFGEAVKIAVALHHFDARRGGAERFAVDLVRYMIEQGHDVDVFSATRGEEIEGAGYQKVDAMGWPGFLYETSFAKRSAMALSGRPYDVILGINRIFNMDIYLPPGGVHRAWFKQDLKSTHSGFARRIRLMGRTLNPKQRLVFRLENRIYREGRIKKVVANSGMVKADIIKHYHLPPEMVEVIYHGVDLEKFHPRNRMELRQGARASLGLKDERAILFAAHNFRLKGLQSFIEVISILKKRRIPNIMGVVVGRGRSRPFQAEADRLGCSELMLFSGTQSDMKGVYAAADLLLQPTFFDPCSLTTLEALASGLPVVTTRYNGAGELMTDGEEGFVVEDPADVEKLADKVEELLDEERLAACSVKARGLARRFPQNCNYAKILALCKEMAGQRRNQ